MVIEAHTVCKRYRMPTGRIRYTRAQQTGRDFEELLGAAATEELCTSEHEAHSPSPRYSSRVDVRDPLRLGPDCKSQLVGLDHFDLVAKSDNPQYDIVEEFDLEKKFDRSVGAR
jgi:hypothetical protein